MRGFIYGYENPVTKTQRWRVFNFGACEGCPTADNIPLQTLDTWVGLNGWKLEDVYHMSWGAAPAWAVPEIYLTNGLHARQWRNVSRLGALKLGSKIDFPGILTQSQACQQRGCNDGTNQTPLAARDQFLSALNNDPYTRQDALRWLTDIRWIVN
jgi:hypothetical protein